MVYGTVDKPSKTKAAQKSHKLCPGLTYIPIGTPVRTCDTRLSLSISVSREGSSAYERHVVDGLRLADGRRPYRCADEQEERPHDGEEGRCEEGESVLHDPTIPTNELRSAEPKFHTHMSSASPAHMVPMKSSQNAGRVRPER